MSLCVMTYNILDGGENREPQILQVIQVARPDVAILQEVVGTEFLKSLSDSLGMSYYIGAGQQKRKVAILSRLPVRTFRSYDPVFPIWRNFIHAEIEYEPNKIIGVIGVHQMASLGIIFELWRFLEAKYILKQSRKLQHAPCLIAGDFNAIAPMDKIETGNMPTWLKWVIYLQGNRVYRFSIQAFLYAGFTDCFRFLHPAQDGFTLPPPNPNTRLDYIFVNAKMKAHLRKCWVVREPNHVINQASDHYPVMAEVSFT